MKQSKIDESVDKRLWNIHNDCWVTHEKLQKNNTFFPTLAWQQEVTIPMCRWTRTYFYSFEILFVQMFSILFSGKTVTNISSKWDRNSVIHLEWHLHLFHFEYLKSLILTVNICSHFCSTLLRLNALENILFAQVSV